MKPQEFTEVALNDSCISAIHSKAPEQVRDDVERISNSTLVRLLLIKAGEKIISVLIGLLQNYLIKKYNLNY
jgi:hypothetical protein